MTLTVLTLNTYLCRMFGVPLAPDINLRTELLASHLEHAHPDLVCLQEVWSRRSLRRLQAALPHHTFISGRGFRPLKPLGSGLRLATRLPILNHRFIRLPGTLRPKEMLATKGMIYAELGLDESILRVVDLHLGIGTAPRQRHQHDAVLEALDHLGQVHILCGDFNQSAAPDVQQDAAGNVHDGYITQQLRDRGYIDTLAAIHGPAADEMVTIESRRNPLIAPGYHVRLDYIWIRSDAEIRLRAIDAHVSQNEPVQDTFISDHYGITGSIEVMNGK